MFVQFAGFFLEFLSDKVKKFLKEPEKHVVPHLFDHEVHLFMHCHLKAYDRTGEGIHPDPGFVDMFGLPNNVEDFWTEGYHSMDLKLASHMFYVEYMKKGQEEKMKHSLPPTLFLPYPPVAGYAG